MGPGRLPSSRSGPSFVVHRPNEILLRFTPKVPPQGDDAPATLA